MIFELLVALGGVLSAAGSGVGAAWFIQMRCAHAWQEKISRYGESDRIVWTRCRALPDPRCHGGNCTAHCRKKELCGGTCLLERVGNMNDRKSDDPLEERVKKELSNL